MTHDLPQFVRDSLANPPRTGQGVHSWIFRVSRHLHAHLPAGHIAQLLSNRLVNCGRRVPHREIVDAVRNSLPCAWQPNRSGLTLQPAQKWPKTNQEQREAIVRGGFGLADLWEISRTRIEDNEAHTEKIIDRLFPGNPLLCCGFSQSKFDTRPREAWRGQLCALQFIVPSPMTSVTGMTKAGHESKHSLSNTGPRRFLVVEFDSGTTDEHAALLFHLAAYGPLVCAVHSGGKSLHGWFFVEGHSEEKTRRFFRYAVSLGADPAMWTRSQFARMPDGKRDNGKVQTVYFLNFKPLGTPHELA